MSKNGSKVNHLGVKPHPEVGAGEEDQSANGSISRRSFLGKGLTLGAVSLGAEFLETAFSFTPSKTGLTKGDVDILTFLAAAEQVEFDLWRQYNELGGVQDNEIPGGSGSKAYTDALSKIDMDIPQYIHDNADDEHSHGLFFNAYLVSKGADPISLDAFHTLPGSKATGAQNVGHLTNLMELTVDTSYWTRYRSSTKNPDLGDTFVPAVAGLSKGKFPGIPRDDNDLEPADHIQAIANTAVFHFAFIEAGGASVLPSLVQHVTDLEVMRILISIGNVEEAQFQTWHDKAGNAPALTDPTNGLVFPDLNSAPFGGEDFSTNLIMPEPTVFLDSKLPRVSILRPTGPDTGAVALSKALVADGLFVGQSPDFLAAVTKLAEAADAAVRGCP